MSAYFKDIFREIKNSIGRFISLMLITALGTASVVGIQASSINMRAMADREYKAHYIYDLQIRSAVGFDDEDIAALRDTEGVRIVMPAYIHDAFVIFEHDTRTVRTSAVPGELNRLEVLEGRLPENAGEAVVERRLLRHGRFSIGDSIRLGLDNMDAYYRAFTRSEFTIVGVVQSPLYISLHERGNTSLGDGWLNFYMYLHPGAYNLPVYTDVFILMENSHGVDNLSQAYYDLLEEWREQVRHTGDMRVQATQDEFADNQREIDEKLAELENARAGIETEINFVNWWLDYIRSETYPITYQYAFPSPEEMAEHIAESYEIFQHQLAEFNKIYAEIEAGLSELAEAQASLNNAPSPGWFYFTRRDGIGFESYYQDSRRLEQIGYVFPLVFFLVAVLVSLTTMSRMVEENRMQIGIYRALGYAQFKIMIKYLFYAFSASITGGIAGIIAGSQIFPRVIFDAYAHLYRMPPVITPIPVMISVIAVSAAVGAILLVTFIACMSSVYSAPAELMRPKAPPAGKRVLIEKVLFIWNRLGFISKVTARNIFRYKKRFIMTLAGVAGCTALLVTAFGLRDSIGGVDVMQFERVIAYSSRAIFREITTAEQRDEIDGLLSGMYLYTREEAVTAQTNKASFSAMLIVPETAEDLSAFINLRERRTGRDVPLMQGGVLLTEKLAREIGVGVGDNFSIVTVGGRSYEARVSGIVENYVMHFIYMAPDVYIRLFGDYPPFNSLLAINASEDERTFAERLLANANVRAVILTEDVKRNLGESTDALQIVTIVLIILACALAFVVLFNLTNINITERIRELATIKVLGFYDSELAMYIYRENGLVTALGIGAGLIGGIWLHRYVLTAAEIDILMFPQIINIESFILSVVLSVVFTVFVNCVMYFKLRKIDMVESLKSVE